MAIDPHPPARPVEADAGPIIDNEIRAYRAITPLAIFAVIFGVLSILTYVNSSFAVFGLLALASAGLARRSIRRLPDVLTGGRLADFGVGLGLLFCLSALTISATQGLLIDRSASRFAEEYVKVLRDGSIEDNVFLQSPAAARVGKTPKEAADEAVKAGPSQMAYEQQVRPYRQIKARLASTPGQTIAFDHLSGHVTDGLEIYANTVYALKGPPSKDFPDEVQYAGVQFRGRTDVAGHDWYVREVQFPITPRAK